MQSDQKENLFGGSNQDAMDRVQPKKDAFVASHKTYIKGWQTINFKVHTVNLTWKYRKFH